MGRPPVGLRRGVERAPSRVRPRVAWVPKQRRALASNVTSARKKAGSRPSGLVVQFLLTRPLLPVRAGSEQERLLPFRLGNETVE